MGSVSVKMSFYSESTVLDGIPVETVLFSDVAGTLETESQMVSEKINMTAFVQLLVFYPAKILSGITTGMKAKNGNDVYSVQYEETYSDHQEIYLRKDNS